MMPSKSLSESILPNTTCPFPQLPTHQVACWTGYLISLFFPLAPFVATEQLWLMFLWHQATFVVVTFRLAQGCKIPTYQVSPVYTIHGDFFFLWTVLFHAWLVCPSRFKKYRRAGTTHRLLFIPHYSKKYCPAEKELIQLWLTDIQRLLGRSHFK